MGFKQRRQLYKLKFEDPEWNGLEVTVRRLTIGQILDFQSRLAEADGDGIVLANVRIDELTAQLIDWNLDDEDTGDPVPANREGVAAQEFEFVMEILNAAGKAVNSISAPLDGGSTSGGTFPEASLPMEPLSPNPSSSLMPVS